MSTTVKLFVSVVAALLIGIRFIFPELKIDSITIGLFIVGLLPWFSEIIKSIKLPSGHEIQLRDLSKATQEFSESVSIEKVSDELSFQSIAELDSNLALVYLRIEIEKRLKELAEINGLNPKKDIRELIHDLDKTNSIDKNTLGGLLEVILAGNQAAHGARVNPSIADWTSLYGPRIIDSLDNEIYKSTPNLLNVRTGPGVNYALAGFPVKKGTNLEIIEETENWAQIRTPDNNTGWVAKKYLLKPDQK